MTGIVLAACLSFAAVACAGPRADPCQLKADAMMDMTFAAFDQGPDGWRSLHDSLACSGHAADALARYRARHGADLAPANVSLLTWHEAQILATQGEPARASALMRQAAFPGEPQWQRLYRDGSIAFLEGDLAGLQGARNALARLPHAPNPTVSGEVETPRPPNLDVLDGLIACFNQPYSLAYACRPAGPSPVGD